MSDIKELHDEDLVKVSGGSQPNTQEQGSKYNVNARVKCYVDGIQTAGKIVGIYWSVMDDQYVYWIENELTRYIIPKTGEVDAQVCWLQAGTVRVKEEDIIYEL